MSAQRVTSHTEVERIRDQLRRAFTGDAWHGPSVGEAMDEFDAAGAAIRLHPGGHSACELALHIAAWVEIATRRANGEDVRPGAEDDWPVPEQDAEPAWRAARQRITATYTAMQELLETMPDEQLDTTVKGKDHNVYVLLHGAIQHALYHAGQMVLLRRVLRSRT